MRFNLVYVTMYGLVKTKKRKKLTRKNFVYVVGAWMMESNTIGGHILHVRMSSAKIFRLFFLYLFYYYYFFAFVNVNKHKISKSLKIL